MVFSSLLFLCVYLPIVLFVYFVSPLKMRNLVLFIVSLIFYAWGEPIYVSIMIFSTILDYTCSLMIGKFKDTPKLKKMFLIVSLVGNLGMLAVFKYLDFIIVSLSHIPGLESLSPFGIVLPIGISFYTFQTMSYTIDVYRGVNEVQKNIINLGAYVTLFPQLIAGPIVKYKDISHELEHRKHSFDSFGEGVALFTIGLCKKVLLANTAGEVFTAYAALATDEISMAGAWISTIAFGTQIYFDFAGYSDMAIGLGKMFSFNFLKNFNYPYIAESITDFWRRWHISMTSWFREYLYIPLGGNRCSNARSIFNIFVVWLVTGFWHGAAWNYVVWGLYYFVIMMAERLFLGELLKKIPRILRWIYALTLVNIGWVLFSNENFTRILDLLYKMFDFTNITYSGTDFFYVVNYALIFAVALVASTPIMKNIYEKLHVNVQNTVKIVLVVLGLFVCTATLVDSTFNPFLYFRF